ncbi:hypothetical protein B0H11DRAFT_1912839 [Mycena galericulata]|nr:hypothetical protein B0H11DRAFT_1912839 [Mycena galericulata]
MEAKCPTSFEPPEQAASFGAHPIQIALELNEFEGILSFKDRQPPMFYVVLICCKPQPSAWSRALDKICSVGNIPVYKQATSDQVKYTFAPGPPCTNQTPVTDPTSFTPCPMLASLINIGYHIVCTMHRQYPEVVWVKEQPTPEVYVIGLNQDWNGLPNEQPVNLQAHILHEFQQTRKVNGIQWKTNIGRGSQRNQGATGSPSALIVVYTAYQQNNNYSRAVLFEVGGRGIAKKGTFELRFKTYKAVELKAAQSSLGQRCRVDQLALGRGSFIELSIGWVNKILTLGCLKDIDPLSDHTVAKVTTTYEI